MSKSSATKKTEAYCPSSAFIDVKKTKNPPKDSEEFKRWVGELAGDKVKLDGAYLDLRECWEYYHPVPSNVPPKSK